jgi:hypothetical protein
MVGGCNRDTFLESVPGTQVHVVSMSRLIREEHTVTDSKFCEGFEILLVSTSNCVFLPTFNAETTLSRRVPYEFLLYPPAMKVPSVSMTRQFYWHRILNYKAQFL